MTLDDILDRALEIPPIPTKIQTDKEGIPIFFGLRFLLRFSNGEMQMSQEFLPRDIVKFYDIPSSRVNKFMMADMKNEFDSYNSDPTLFFNNDLFSLCYLIEPIDLNSKEISSVDVLWQMEPSVE